MITESPLGVVPPRFAVLFDWGGVLTPPIHVAFGSWLAADGIDAQHFAAVMDRWLGLLADRTTPTPGRRPPDSPVHALERGELEPARFEQTLAKALAELGSPVPADGLLHRMLAGLAPLDEQMIELVREVRRRGALTGLLSNSWGDHYPERLFDGLFDTIVISGRVGLRKPEPAIFRLAAERLGIPVTDCLFVDDLAVNIDGARRVGMAAVLHTSHAQTSAAVLSALPTAATDSRP